METLTRDVTGSIVESSNVDAGRDDCQEIKRRMWTLCKCQCRITVMEPNYYKPPRYGTSCPRDSSCAVSQLLLT